MKKRFKSLRLIAFVFMLIGALAALFTILLIAAFVSGFVSTDSLFLTTGPWGPGGFEGMLDSSYALSPLTAAIMTLIYGGMMSFSFFASGQFILLLLGVEENTRLTAMTLEALIREEQPTTEIPTI